MLCKRKGQSTLEYALIIAVVVAALLSVHAYLRRSITGRLRVTSGAISEQFDPEDFSVSRTRTGGQVF